MVLRKPCLSSWVGYLAAIMWMAGCADTAGSRGFAVRDSAGVAISESTSPLWNSSTSWRLADEPSLSIGVEDGDSSYLFHGVVGTQRLSGGRTAVADYGSHEIRVYDAAGQFLFSAGGEGDGPGEYRFMSLFWRLPGDTLVVSSSRGLTLFNATGSYIGSIGLEPTPDGQSAQGVAQLDDGTILATSFAAQDQSAGNPFIDRTARFYSHTPGGAFVFLDSVPAGPLWRPEGSPGPRRIPFHTFPGRAAAGGRFYIAQGDEPEIGIWNRAGQFERLIRWVPPDRTLTSELFDRYRQHQLDRATSPEIRRREEQFLDEAPMPERLPALAESPVLVSRTGEVWAEAYRLPWETESKWYVFSEDGEWLGFVPMPLGFVLHDVDADVVVGAQRDELGVEYVRIYPLIKP